MQAHEPLLDAELGLQGASVDAHVWRGTITHGARATLTVKHDGSFQLKEDPPGHKFLFLFPQSVDISVSALDVVGASPVDTSSVQLWYMPLRNPSSKTPVRQLRKTPLFKLTSSTEAAALVTAIQATLLQHQRRRVLAIINPASGRGVAPKVYTRQVKPILEAAGMLLTEVATSAQGHATRILKKVNSNEFDLILSLGGDGTMFEVLQGVLQRPDWEEMKNIPLLQIPCGSGNALAASSGLWDVPTAVHAAIKGQKIPLDIASVVQQQQQQQPQVGGTVLEGEEGTTGVEQDEETGRGDRQQDGPVRFFSFLSCTYGMLSCLDIGTEHLRWLGSTRFIVGAVQQIIMQHTFKIKVAYLDAPSDIGSGGGGGGSGSGNVAVASGADDVTHSIEDGIIGNSNLNLHGNWHSSTADNSIGYGPSLQHFKNFSPIIATSLLRNNSNINTSTTITTATSHSASTSPTSLPLLPTGWHWLPADNIQLFAACNLPQLDMNFLFAPDATLNSGHFNLIYTTGKSGWVKGLALLTAAEQGNHMHLVQQRKVKAFWIEPLARSGATWLVCDGEQVPHEALYAEVHPGLVATLKAPEVQARITSSNLS